LFMSDAISHQAGCAAGSLWFTSAVVSLALNSCFSFSLTSF